MGTGSSARGKNRARATHPSFGRCTNVSLHPDCLDHLSCHCDEPTACPRLRVSGETATEPRCLHDGSDDLLPRFYDIRSVGTVGTARHNCATFPNPSARDSTIADPRSFAGPGKYAALVLDTHPPGKQVLAPERR